MAISEVIRKAFFYDEWDIGIYMGNIESFIKPDSVSKINWLRKHSKYSFVADPFIFQSNGKLQILAEYFNYFTCKGKIVSLETDINFSSLKISNEIITKYHMSYSFIFEYMGEKYCIPETGQANKLMLFQYNDISKQFKYKKDLIENFACVDSTILYHENKWWLFCTKGPDKANSDLFIWYSDNPLEGWEQHKNNPVKSDIASARPAGNFFYMDGQLYRPSQNCAKTYGGSIVINKIIKLDEKSFEEVKAFEINPAKESCYRDGIHTLSIGNNFIIVDGKKLQFSLLNLLFIIIQKIRAKINSRNNEI